MITRLRPIALVPIATCVMGLGTAGVAQASDASLKATVLAAIPQIQHTQAGVLDGLSTFERTHSSTKLVRAITVQDATLRRFQHRISRDEGSTSAGRAGRKDIVRGLRLIVSSNAALVRDLRNGTATSEATVKRIVAKARTGNLDLERGAKLLKV